MEFLDDLNPNYVRERLFVFSREDIYTTLSRHKKIVFQYCPYCDEMEEEWHGMGKESRAALVEKWRQEEINKSRARERDKKLKARKAGSNPATNRI